MEKVELEVYLLQVAKKDYNLKYKKNNFFLLQKVVFNRLLLFSNHVLPQPLFKATSNAVYFSRIWTYLDADTLELSNKVLLSET